ncbi:dTDP-4-dehydrorhamnose 3,5-epimerase family protein [Saccharothrix obliqua]|uniref:dTDP-4-dehydrorhamnose 3,5-epimerase family protein n=1 Tax=Saccharothrix obliqua TaxID=2861747 RepID=UPI001C5F8E1B|nr:dTDP-4-dehydrorhamnose 3,5-epimerase family protein [Saccharothrix obliqua]MBW4721885.1 dTDP-4-dehydrorhamnose 3,5-epimerase family protein [Saccharothrix obliqua]
MRITEMAVPGCFRLTPEVYRDQRGLFYEAFRHEPLAEAIGHPFTVRQANCSVSRYNTLRGIHGTVLPPGQEKLVTCVDGAVLDVAVDIRVGSPTFGMFDATRLEEGSGVSVYLADGIGHAFLVLTPTARVHYLVSTEYVPGTMIDLDALDPDLGLPWDTREPPIRSEKDTTAPTLAEAASAGLLPTYQECLDFAAGLG